MGIIRKYSDQHEKRITKKLKDLSAKRRMASGAVWVAKGDISTSRFLIEAKTKVRPSTQMTVKKEWLDKIEEEALLEGKIPVLVISFGDNIDYFILRDRDFLELAACGEEEDGPS